MSALQLIDSLIHTFRVHSCNQHTYSTAHIEQKAQSQNRDIRRLDKQLRIYYQQHDTQYDWDEKESKGLFAKWCEENEYDDDSLKDDLNETANDAPITEFDKHFPLRPNIIDQQERIEKIFKILKCICRGQELLFANEFDLNVSTQQILETWDIYRKHIKTWGVDGDFTKLKDINILYFLTVSRIKGNNLLLHLIDSYNRDIITNSILKMDNSTETNEFNNVIEEQRVTQWISSTPFLRQLDKKVKEMKVNFAEINMILYQESTKKNGYFNLDLRTLIHTYPQRMGKRLDLSGRLINDDLETVSSCIVGTAKFVEKLIKCETNTIGGTPCLIDFIILLEPSINGILKPQNNDVSDSDDDDDDFQNIKGMFQQRKIDNDIVGDVIDHLEKNKCIFHKRNVSQIVNEKGNIDIEAYHEIVPRCIMDGFRELRSKVKNNTYGSYPMNERVNIIIDRRNYYKKQKNSQDLLITFQPPSDCNIISNTTIPECYFDLSRLCLIPRLEYGQPIKYGMSESEKLKAETITAQTTSQGQVMTLSYHICAADEIKCYLLWNGKSHRFFPQDILDVLPHMFRKDRANKMFAQSDKAKKLIMEMPLNDSKFEIFYRAIHGWSKYQYIFPKKYKVMKNK